MKPMNPIKAQQLSDVLVTAIEGGSAYWANDSDVARDHEVTRTEAGQMAQWTFEHDVDGKGWKKADISIKALGSAINKANKGEFNINDSLRSTFKKIGTDEFDCDADAADCLVQLAAFGELVFS